MKSFLEHVASDILSKHGSDLSRVAVVFPNKRASIFLNDALVRTLGRPLWSPAYLTISDLFRHHSPYAEADPLKLVSDLYKVFISVTNSSETLDQFFSWGQLLLSDFDDIDKNMANADQVFGNLSGLHEMDTVSFLTPEQRTTLENFFDTFHEGKETELKERFLRLWSKLATIYHSYRQTLFDQGIAYEGALFRAVAEDEQTEFEYDKYIFVGFNLLQEVEQKLFRRLTRSKRAFFYWDFDHFYMGNGHEAGHFIGEYLADFPNELDIKSGEVYGQFSMPKDITFTAATTDNMQARQVSDWLLENERYKDGRRTAIVMCNELLLPAVLHSIPPEVKDINITTGFPLSQMPIVSLLQSLLSLQQSGYDQRRHTFKRRYLLFVQAHPYVRSYLSGDADILYVRRESLAERISWLTTIVGRIVANSRSDAPSPLFQESLFRAYTMLSRFQTLMESGDLPVDAVTFQRLFSQQAAVTSIPFHGEPAVGIQVMGVLETRNLDFDHVLILSANEGVMPRGLSDSSFIPYSIRKAHGLTTSEHKTAIYAYYFYRLLQRAADVTISYNQATEGTSRGEKSRFMLQLMAESPHYIRLQTLLAPPAATVSFCRPAADTQIEKTPEVIDKLLSRFTGSNPSQPLLTPTALNRYLRCQLMFYYRYVADLKEPMATADDTTDNRLFGLVFHDASQRLYKRFEQSGEEVTATKLRAIINNDELIRQAVDNAMQHALEAEGIQAYHREGLQLIQREVIITYVRRLLTIDQRLTPFHLLGLEIPVAEQRSLILRNGMTFNTVMGGTVDRLDRIVRADGTSTIRVVDYKTGAHDIHTPLAGVEDIFVPANVGKHSDYYLQTFLYSDIVARNARLSHHHPVSPALLFIQKGGAEGYDPTLSFGTSKAKKTPITDISEHADAFRDRLDQLVCDIFDDTFPFTPKDTDPARCEFCPYKELCPLFH